ncbi:MAG: riboflavin synthase [Deltaproteobacteria bacterium]|nr:riboflavin synthase [Deltaproteobacteria bacterium]
MMFTGLVEGTGKIRSITLTGGDMRLSIVPLFDMTDCKLGESVSVNGVCLTVTEVNKNIISMYVSRETVSSSSLGGFKQGQEVNLERALTISSRLGGHLVSGHIDAVGRILKKERVHDSWLMRIETDKSISKYIIRKGSIAVDGISLTVNNCEDTFFEVNIIPETARMTTILNRKVGDLVNIETDLIGKYIEGFLTKERKTEKGSSSNVDMEMLNRYGFGK